MLAGGPTSRRNGSPSVPPMRSILGPLGELITELGRQLVLHRWLTAPPVALEGTNRRRIPREANPAIAAALDHLILFELIFGIVIDKDLADHFQSEVDLFDGFPRTCFVERRQAAAWVR